MPRPPKVFNPFYLLLLLAGGIFAVTACAYAVLMVRGIDPALQNPAQQSALLRFMHENGFQALMVELAVLAVATIGAIGTDDYWARRTKQRDGNPVNDEVTQERV